MAGNRCSRQVRNSAKSDITCPKLFRGGCFLNLIMIVAMMEEVSIPRFQRRWRNRAVTLFLSDLSRISQIRHKSVTTLNSALEVAELGGWTLPQ
jgi:hypothetical protein